MSPPLAIYAEALAAGYGARGVLSDVGWQVEPGSLWAVLGPNGAGKSTLLRASLGLLRPSAGHLRIFGRPVAEWERREFARKVAWVPQRFDAEAGFTALEVVVMGASPRLGLWGLPGAQDVERARAVLAELGAAHLAGRPTAALSGGEQRLVWLARALVQAPELLLLDEPTAFLDLRHQVSTLRLLKTRVRAGLTAVAVLHDVNLALAYADRVLLLDGGRVLARGPAKEVLTREAVERLYGVPVSEAHSESGARFFAPEAT